MGRHEDWANQTARLIEPNARFKREKVASVSPRADLLMDTTSANPLWGTLQSYIEGGRTLLEFFSSNPCRQTILQCKIKLLASGRMGLKKRTTPPTMLALRSGAGRLPLSDWGFEEVVPHIHRKVYCDTCTFLVVDTDRVAVSDCPIAPFFVNIDRIDVDRVAQSFAHPHMIDSIKAHLSEMIMSTDYGITEKKLLELSFQEVMALGNERGRREGISEGRREGISEGRREGISEGRREGISEGRREGILEGRRAGQRAALLKIISAKCTAAEYEALRLITDVEVLEQRVVALLAGH